MKPVISKAICTVFLLLWAIPLLVMSWFALKEQWIRGKMKHQLEHRVSELTRIKIPTSEVKWVEDNEIVVNGVMFDIESYSINDGIYTFQGMFDEEETTLIAQRKTAAGKGLEDNKLLSQIMKWLEVAFDNSSQYLSGCQVLFINHTTILQEKLLRLPVKVLTPPPRGTIA